jgi:hypothetical protein
LLARVFVFQLRDADLTIAHAQPVLSEEVLLPATHELAAVALSLRVAAGEAPERARAATDAFSFSPLGPTVACLV